MHFHPKDTAEAYKGANKEKIAHLAYHLNYNQLWQNDRNGRFEARPIQQKPIYSNDLLQVVAQVEQQRQAAFAELTNAFHVRQLRAKKLSNIIHGLGAAHVRETAITIHGVYGVPYIPASSLKGLVRAWFIEAFCDGQESKLAEHPIGCYVFGTQEHSGIAQFYDVFLHRDLALAPDILSTHYPEYYQGKRGATDDQKLNLVKFWTVSISSATIFVSLQKHLPKELQAAIVPRTAEELAKAVAQWTAKALTELGIGSKTSSGYGLFQQIDDVTETELGAVAERMAEANEKAQKKREQQQQEEAARVQKEQEEAALAAMSPEEQLVFKISALDPTSEADREASKELYTEVKASNIKQAAEALKAFWEKAGEWNVKKNKKKQLARVEELKKLLM